MATTPATFYEIGGVDRLKISGGGAFRLRILDFGLPFESLRALSRSTTLTALSPSKGMVEGRIERRKAKARGGRAR